MLLCSALQRRISTGLHHTFVIKAPLLITEPDIGSEVQGPGLQCVSVCLSQTEEKSVQRAAALLADLRRRSTSIAPLKLRRIAPTRAITVGSLCDWETDKVQPDLSPFRLKV